MFLFFKKIDCIKKKVLEISRRRACVLCFSVYQFKGNLSQYNERTLILAVAILTFGI